MKWSMTLLSYTQDKYLSEHLYECTNLPTCIECKVDRPTILKSISPTYILIIGMLNPTITLHMHMPVFCDNTFQPSLAIL